MRRLLVLVAIATLPFASRAEALTVRDVIQLSRAGVSDQVLLALIDVDNRVYTIDADAVGGSCPEDTDCPPGDVEER